MIAYNPLLITINSTEFGLSIFRIFSLLVMHFSKFGRLRIRPFVSSVVASAEVDEGVVVSIALATVATRQMMCPNDQTIL